MAHRCSGRNTDGSACRNTVTAAGQRCGAGHHPPAPSPPASAKDSAAATAAAVGDPMADQPAAPRRKISSTKWVQLPDGLTAEPVQPGAYGARDNEKAYLVRWDGKPIGKVESGTVETYRKHGRIRYPTGRRKVWRAEPDGPLTGPSGRADTRAEAVAILVAVAERAAGGNTTA